MAPSSDLVVARLRRRTLILVCRKCLKRAPKGDELRRALKAAVKRVAEHAEQKPRLVMTSCFGLCPKRAVVVATGATLSRGECLLLANEADAEKAAALLLQDRLPTRD